MKYTPEDPRLTRYLLGELSPKEAEAFEDAMVKNPQLRIDLVHLQDTQNFLGTHLSLPETKLQPAQRQHILHAARSVSHTLDMPPVPRLRSLSPYLLPLSAAAVFVMVVSIKRPNATEPLAAPAMTHSSVPALPATVAAVAPPRVKSSILENRSALARVQPSLDLPVQVGVASYELISQSVHQAQRLPEPASVRLEEILNSFSYRLHGVTAIARSASSSSSWHPDHRDASVSPLNATLSSELITCPWKPSSTLLILSLKGNAKNPVEAQLTYLANPDSVSRYHLLGFNPIPDQAAGVPSTQLARDATSTLAIEIETSNAGTELGLLQWSTAGKLAPSISLIRKADAEPSDDARFAALVCTYSQWLAGEQPTVIDADLVAGLAREIDSSSLPKDREDFLRLVDRSLYLAEKK
jgi:anti-sigma factor RsiW